MQILCRTAGDVSRLEVSATATTPDEVQCLIDRLTVFKQFLPEKPGRLAAAADPKIGPVA